MKFIITRHATTDWNLEKRTQGHTDRSLAPQGIEEARHLAEKLKDFGASLIVASDLKRSLETAEIFRETLEVVAKSDKRLRECMFGSLEGTTESERLALYGTEIDDYFGSDTLPYDFTRFGGESRQEVLNRHIELFKELAATGNGDDPILIVGHGRGLNTFLGSIGQEANLVRGEYRIIDYN